MTNNTPGRAYFTLKNCAAIFLLLCVTANRSLAQTRQTALIIGIDTYRPSLNDMAASDNRRTWTKLYGEVNDATAMKDLAIAKYSFKQENIPPLIPQAT